MSDIPPHSQEQAELLINKGKRRGPTAKSQFVLVILRFRMETRHQDVSRSTAAGDPLSGGNGIL